MNIESHIVEATNELNSDLRPYAENPDAILKPSDPNALSAISALTSYWRFCFRKSQEEFYQWKYSITIHFGSLEKAVIPIPDFSDPEWMAKLLNYDILTRFQEYFLIQYKIFSRIKRIQYLQPHFIHGMDVYRLEDLPDIIVEVGFERWRLGPDGDPIRMPLRSAFFVPNPVTYPPSQFVIVPNTTSLYSQILQRLIHDGSGNLDFPAGINGQYIMQTFKTIIAVPTSYPGCIDQRPSGEKYDPEIRDLIYTQVWKMKRAPPSRSLRKRKGDARRLAPIMKARRELYGLV